MPGLRLIRDTPHVDFIARCAVGTAVTSHRQHTHTHLAWYPENILHDAVTVCWIAAMTTLHSSHDSIQSNAIEICNFFLSGNFLFGCWSEKKSKSAHLYEGEMQSCIICILNVEYWMKYERFKFETDRSLDDRDIRLIDAHTIGALCFSAQNEQRWRWRRCSG